MASTRQRILDAMIEQIGACLLKSKNSRTGYMHHIGPYNGEIDQTDGPDGIRRAFRGQFPGILISPEGASVAAQSTTRRLWNRSITVELYVGSNHLRTREDRLKTDVVAEDDPTADPGIWQIVEDIHNIVAGNDFDLNCVGFFDPSREDPMLKERDFTIWRMTYEVDTDLKANKRDHSDQPLTGYSLNANIDPHPKDDTPNPVVESDDDTLQS